MPRTKQTKKSKEVNPKESSGKVAAVLDRNSIKLRLQAALKRQILAQVGKNSVLSDDGLEAAGLRDGTEVPDEISTNNWLEWQHVYGLIPALVAQRPHLRNVVGVFPAFTLNRVNGLIEDAAETKIIDNLGLKTRVTPDGDVTLLEKEIPSDKGLTKKQLAYWKGVRTKRNKDAKERREQAKALLVQSSLGENESFLLYLEAIGESKEHFLGNPQNRNLTIDNCEQLIIPFHYHDNHYTVAVVHFTEEDDKDIAQIKYYDSMGSDLNDSLKKQLITYCENLGFEAKYECVSKHDQKDGVHCSIFSSFKAIDVANENAGDDERFLDKLTDDNYNAIIYMLRYLVSLKLKQSGQNVTPSDDLVSELKYHQENFKQLSVHSQKVSEVNSLLLDIKFHFEKALNPRAKGGPLSKALPDINPNDLLKDCERLYQECKTRLEALQKKTKQTNKDKTTIAALQSLMQAYELVNQNLQTQIQKLAQLQATSMFAKVKAWVLSLSWKQLALLLPLSFVGSLIGGHLLLKLLVGSPLLVAGAGIFASGMFAITFINRFIYPESQQGEFVVTRPAKEAEKELMPELEEVLEMGVPNPTMLKKFDKDRQKPSAGSARAPIEICEVGPDPKAKKKLSFE
ncbi:MAG: hypothetical protein JSR17_03260 [Proteobacteria bacterium]|nr:hypothetical protein [Pseudomonadota bacterium]